MIIVGGTYDEVCFEPRWEEKFGSGFRACRAVISLDSKLPLAFYTFGDANTKLFLDQVGTVFPSIKSTVVSIEKSISFYYDHPLITPRIYPRLDTINKADNVLSVTGSDILYFGFIEGNAIVNGERVVYDPQSPTNPQAFTQTGSQAKELAVVINLGEATKIAKSADIRDICHFFLNRENATVLVLKMGAKGAMVFDKNGLEDNIPVYETKTVWPIGSGDVFASVFAYYWFKGYKASGAADKASRCTAAYCSTRSLSFAQADIFRPLLMKEVPQGKVYLAGPFFTYAERWLIDQIRSGLKAVGLSVFSPWHDIGHGIASEVVPKDIEGLEQSKLVFAVIDGLDSGTLFEVGYAIKKGIPVIGYVENETQESVKMLEGTGCTLVKDLTTAIYKSFWLLANNE